MHYLPHDRQRHAEILHQFRGPGPDRNDQPVRSIPPRFRFDFDTPIIGRQRLALEMTASAFRNEVSRARTFGFMADVERLWKNGLALGANLNNTVAIGDDRILNRDGLRCPQEFVRHKTLDAVGDLALAGHPLLGAFRSVRGGHRLNSNVLKALFADDTAWTIVQAPRVRDVVSVDMGIGAAAVALAE